MKFIACTCLVLPLLALALSAKAQTPATSPAIAPPGQLKIAYHGRFSELPLGSVKPQGWIKGWLERQLNGMTGHPGNLGYPYDTIMYAGKIPPPTVRHGQDWWPYEQSGYFVDGAVRLGLLIDVPGARSIAEANLKHILEHSGPGQLGESVWGWPNAVVGRALMAQYSATGDTQVAQVLMDSVRGARGLGGRDGYVFEQALYLYGQTGDPRLLDLAKRVYDRLFVSDARSFSTIDKIRSDKPLREHGVTAAEQLKLLPLMYAYTGDAQALELAGLAYRKVEADSLMPDGGIVSSESMSTTAFDSMHETCDITDWSWSFGYMLIASGEGHWADRIEQATFNALPGAVTKDFRQLQYFSSANQVLASNTACTRIAPTRMSYRAAHDTECCTDNVNRAMPNYVSRMWMRMDNGIAATLYGPSEVNTIINGQAVTVTEETEYPFRDTITLKIKSSTPVTFPLGLRIPEWCVAASVTINGAPSDVKAAPGTFANLNREFHDGDTIALHLPMNVLPRQWFGGAGISVQRGSLVYSLKIDEKRIESREDIEQIKRVLKGNNIGGFPAVEFFPQSEWRFGIDSALAASPGAFKVIESTVADNPFEAEHVPVRIEVALRALPGWAASWKPVLDPAPSDIRNAAHNPTSMPSQAELDSSGQSRTMTLVPYGSTHLRLTTLPIIKPEKP